MKKSVVAVNCFDDQLYFFQKKKGWDQYLFAVLNKHSFTMYVDFFFDWFSCIRVRLMIMFVVFQIF